MRSSTTIWCALRVLAIAMMTQTCGCHVVPHLVDTLGSPVDQTGFHLVPDLRQTAPVIAEAYVLDNVVLRRRIPAARMPKVLLDLHRVHARVEVALRGALGGQLDFYYFVQAMDSPEPNPFYGVMFRAEPGGRYIFFLDHERGVLRSVGDVGDYSIQVFSGAHDGYRPARVSSGYHPGETEVGRAIQDILLTKGAGVEPESFAFGIDSSARAADRWGSRLRSVQLLRVLLAEPEPVRGAACESLARNYLSDDCLFRIKDDEREPAAARERARSWLAKRAAQDAWLVQTLRDPARIDLLGSDSRQGTMEQLEILLDSPNIAIRKAACVALARYYPYESTACGG